MSAEKLYPILSIEALKVLLPFSTLYPCKVGSSAMVGIKNKFQNKLQLANSLCLKLAHIDVDINAILVNRNKHILLSIYKFWKWT